MTTHLRRKLAFAGVLAALAVPMLSACGDHYATDRENDLADGAFDLNSDVRILAPRIVASADGQGILIGTLALNPSLNAATMPSSIKAGFALTDVKSANGSVDEVSGLDRKVNQQGFLNLATGGVPVSGTFRAGDMIPLTFTFANGDSGTVQTKVVRDCGYNKGAGQEGFSTPTSDPSPSTAVNPGPYDCAFPELPPLG